MSTRPTLKCQNCTQKFRPTVSAGMLPPMICTKCKRGESDDRRRAAAAASPAPDGDAVNHPSHYRANGIEVIDVIEAFGCNFNIGNAVKYVLRHDRKSPGIANITDLRKAVWYLEREITNLEKA